jgi:hypothetical protein
VALDDRIYRSSPRLVEATCACYNVRARAEAGEMTSRRLRSVAKSTPSTNRCKSVRQCDTVPLRGSECQRYRLSDH